MKFTLSWLKDHLETEAPLEAIVAALTQTGLEVERVEDPAAALGAFRVAQILSAAQHPNADRLRVCAVDTGAGAPVQVVCGAPNARAGLKTVFAPPGAVIPAKKITLSKGVIRGVESNGMLCSAAELEISEEADGILELPGDAPVGGIYAAYAGLDDPVIEINLTPNRPDAMGVAGIARDLAAAGLGRLRSRPAEPVPGTFPCPVVVSLDLAAEDAALAPVFALRLVRGVRNGPSPAWLQARLKAIGLRPVNALVDVTNFLSFDRARPLHVFDAAKVSGALRVRRARDGERLLALDGRTYALDPEVVVIADDLGVESLAGIMGGEASGCGLDTTDVLIESALWDPTNIARSGRRLGINSDARYRFERGVDPADCLPGLDRATGMVLDLCGGTPSAVALAGTVPVPDHRIVFPWSEVHRLTGLDLPTSDMAAILERLGFELALVAGNGDEVVVKVPSFRPDVHGKADLVEEIVRIAGLDRVLPQPLPRATAGVAPAVLTRLQGRTRLARRTLAASGLVEAVTWSFVSHEAAALFGGGAAALRLANPIAADLSDMRPSLLPGLAAAAARNAARGFPDVALFEVGQVFLDASETGQRTAAAALRGGLPAGRSWRTASRPADAFDAKADAVALLAALGQPTAALQVVPGAPAWFHPGRSGTLQLGPKTIFGHFGELHPRVLAALGIDGRLVACEIRLDDISVPKSRPTKARAAWEAPDLMPVRRDFAFLAGADVPAAEIVKAVAGAERTLIADASVFDVYEGAGVPAGQKSVGVTVTLQPREATLTDADLERLAVKIVADVEKRTGAVLRG